MPTPSDDELARLIAENQHHEINIENVREQAALVREYWHELRRRTAGNRMPTEDVTHLTAVWLAEGMNQEHDEPAGGAE